MSRRKPWSVGVLGGALLSGAMLAAPSGAAAAIDPLSGIDFVTIGATYGGAGNAAYQSGQANQFVNGRGSVAYEYKIGRMEVTTAQWVEFYNAAFDRPSNDLLPHLIPPDPGHWGAQSATPNTPGAKRWSVIPGQDLHAVGDIGWRMAAMYCNWLHNGKSLDRSAFLSGAYDVSTFGFFGNIFTDQLAHSPDAKYWVPTWDEWLKAAHFDPDKDNGDGTTGGWWQYGNTSDTLPVYGPPGVGGGGQANAGNNSSFGVPLGAYPDEQSPWGLLDVAGGTSEWTETVRDQGTGGRYRVYDGSHWFQDSFQSSLVDRLRERAGDEFPHIATFETGLRIASLVPTPGAGALGVGVFVICAQRRRRSARSSAHAGAALLLG